MSESDTGQDWERVVRRAVKKPIPAEFIQFDGSKESWQTIFEWAGTYNVRIEGSQLEVEGEPVDLWVLFIATVEGKMKALPGSYIVKGIENEFWPVKESIFKATYDVEKVSATRKAPLIRSDEGKYYSEISPSAPTEVSADALKRQRVLRRSAGFDPSEIDFVVPRDGEDAQGLAERVASALKADADEQALKRAKRIRKAKKYFAAGVLPDADEMEDES